MHVCMYVYIHVCITALIRSFFHSFIHAITFLVHFSANAMLGNSVSVEIGQSNSLSRCAHEQNSGS